MNVGSVLYIDRRGREIWCVPGDFIVINYLRREPEVIFDLRRLKRRARNWNTDKASLKKFIGNPEVDKKDLDEIWDVYFQGKVNEAKRDCVDLFDAVVNREYGINSETRGRTCQ